MSKKEDKARERAQTAKENSQKKAKMRFTSDMFYNDPTIPKYVSGEVAEIVGGDMIQRWLKRGAEIVDDKTPVGKPEADKPKVEAPKVPDEVPKAPVKEEPVESVEEKAEDKSKPAQAAPKKNGKQ